jgi:heterodisulfide reductase subunit A
VNLARKHIAVIGGGVAGLTAADALAEQGIQVSLFEKAAVLGGHAAQLACKATDSCVKCGACMVQDKLQRATARSRVDIYTATTVAAVSDRSPFNIRYRANSAPDGTDTGTVAVDAILVATGFSPYEPTDKPYGYGQFPNVVTSLEAERILRRTARMKRPSDGRTADRIAFVQCVGSRETRKGHLWCSKICCGSSMRMARLIQFRQPEAQITFFYIDVQTFGKDFDCVYREARDRFEMVRAIPGEIRDTDADQLEAIYFDPDTHQSKASRFDLVVLSVGLHPGPDSAHLAGMLDHRLDLDGFIARHGSWDQRTPAGVFTAGTATGPMSVAESVSSAEKAVFDIVRSLGAR